MNKTFLIAGGDLRQLYLGEVLAKDNKVYVIGFDRNVIATKNMLIIDSLISLEERVDYIVLPLPATLDGASVNTPFCKHSIPLDNLAPLLSEEGIVFGGRLSPAAKSLFERRSVVAVDYFEREELSVLNAVPTAEGALQLAMEELPTTIYGQDVLVTGFGRIAKVLTKLLVGMGARVWVAARKYSDLAWAEICGCTGVHITKMVEVLPQFGLVFNTVPAAILDEEKLKLLRLDCLVIDLASKPGGVDFDMAANIGIKTIWALSLPGKVAPVTSGKMIAKTILNILTEIELSKGGGVSG